MSTITLGSEGYGRDVRPAFVRRFESVRIKARLVGIAGWAAVGGAVFLLGLLALAGADYLWELPRAVRAQGLIVAVGAGVACLLAGVSRAWRRTRRTQTAQVIERLYPDLGQSVRTVMQYGNPAAAGQLGAAPSLAAALADDTARRAGLLPLESLVPVRRLLISLAVLLAAGLTLLVLSQRDWEWNTAIAHALLNERPWTTLAVTPGQTAVVEGADLPLALTLGGRTNRDVALFWRAVGTPDWSEEALAAAKSQPQSARFQALLPRVMEPLEYRVTAGALSAGPFGVAVRRPLTVTAVAAEIRPPAYTGLAARQESSGDVTVLEHSRLTFRIEMDGTPVAAELTVSPLGQPGQPRPPAGVVPVVIEGTTLVAAMDDVREPFDWAVRATSADGLGVREHGFRVRIRHDGPPQVWFESPDDAIEVTTLAEVLMRVRVRDDYGLGTAGIVFQINNEEEHTLTAEEFAALTTDVATEPTPQTRATLERKLPLEFFELTQKDSVTYHAFVTDNRPEEYGGPQRMTTDLRFVDIRPFRRIYRYTELGEPGESVDTKLMTLEEIIRRERYVLNRTLRAETLLADMTATGNTAFDYGVVDRLARTQTELATATRDLAEFLDAREIDGADLMFQAEAAMLSASDSLGAASLETAGLQEKDALRYLVEARNTIQIFLLENPEAARAIQEADQRMSQKLRTEQEASAKELAEELRELAKEEEMVSEGLEMLGAAKPQAGGETGEETTDENAEAMTGQGQAPTRAELEEQQSKIARKAADVGQRLEETEGMTDLAKTRMQAASQKVEQAAGELARGDGGAAATSTAQAAEQLEELAEQVEALLAGEPARQIAAARDMAEELAAEQRELGEQMGQGEASKPGDAKPGDAKSASGGSEAGEEMKQAQKAQAGRIARGGATLLDLLQSVIDAEDPAAAETAGRLAEAMRAEDLEATAAELQRQAEQLGGGTSEPLPAEAQELAGRLESAARRLDKLYRAIVAPELDELARLEARAAMLAEQLETVENRPQAAGFSIEARDLLEELEAVAGLGTRDLRDRLGSDGFAVDSRGLLVPTPQLRTAVRRVQSELQARIQELLLADMVRQGDDAVPTAYRDLVDRYYQTLSKSATPAAAE